jgi:two-component system phosphate regulon response regulator PhoB
MSEVTELDGFDVVREQRGESAWRLVSELRPALVVTDHRLPEGTGLDLTKRIRMHPETVDLPVILITAFSNAFIERTAEDTPHMELITKPTRRADFIGAVHRVLEEKGDSPPKPGRA